MVLLLWIRRLRLREVTQLVSIRVELTTQRKTPLHVPVLGLVGLLQHIEPKTVTIKGRGVSLYLPTKL